MYQIHCGSAANLVHQVHQVSSVQSEYRMGNKNWPPTVGFKSVLFQCKVENFRAKLKYVILVDARDTHGVFANCIIKEIMIITAEN